MSQNQMKFEAALAELYGQQEVNAGHAFFGTALAANVDFERGWFFRPFGRSENILWGSNLQEAIWAIEDEVAERKAEAKHAADLPEVIDTIDDYE